MSYFKKIQAQGRSTGTYFPLGVNDNAADVVDTVLTDVDGNVVARSAVLTDEGSILDPFSGNALNARWTTLSQKTYGFIFFKSHNLYII